MINPQDYLKAGQQIHGHKCPAMPMGLPAVRSVSVVGSSRCL